MTSNTSCSPLARIPGGLGCFRFSKYSLDYSANQNYNSAYPAPHGDVSRSSRHVGAGCDGRRDVRHVRMPDEAFAAYGEVVWSWRRDPGATLAEAIPPATGARKAASPGRVRISRQTIARGKPGCFGCTCQSRVHLLLPRAHGAYGRSRRPAFPAPSARRGTTNLQNSGEITPRE